MVSGGNDGTVALSSFATGKVLGCAKLTEPVECVLFLRGYLFLCSDEIFCAGTSQGQIVFFDASKLLPRQTMQLDVFIL